MSLLWKSGSVGIIYGKIEHIREGKRGEDFVEDFFVLEDEWIQQSRIEAVLQDLIRQKSLQCKAPEVFGKSSQLLDAITERGAHHLFSLDIEIKGEEKKGSRDRKRDS